MAGEPRARRRILAIDSRPLRRFLAIIVHRMIVPQTSRPQADNAVQICRLSPLSLSHSFPRVAQKLALTE
jgi:hypothetical protein